MESYVPIAEFCHAEQLAPGVPSPPVFSVMDASAVTDHAGFSQIHLVGRGPLLEALIGMDLIVTMRGRMLSFGMVHPRWLNGPEAPFHEAFAITIDDRLAGVCRAGGRVDVEIVEKSGQRSTTYVFTYIDWEDFLSPPAWKAFLAKMAASEEE